MLHSSIFPSCRTKIFQATKCGRYGPNITDFDYSLATIRASVKRSLARLNTEYLDAVYLHDVEFVCTPFGPTKPGNSLAALSDERSAYGLDDGDEGKVRGEGDRKILEAIAELRKMQEEGLIKFIGITGVYMCLPCLQNYSWLSMQKVIPYPHFCGLHY